MGQSHSSEEEVIRGIGLNSDLFFKTSCVAELAKQNYLTDLTKQKMENSR